MQLQFRNVVLVGFLVLATGLGVYVWQGLGDVDISGHGIAALALGVVLTLGLGIGLMCLVFYSNRKGHDDAAHNNSAPSEED